MPTVLVVGEHHTLPAAELYETFGSARAGTGWLLGAECDAVRPGAAVSADVPLDGSGAAVRLLGRISGCVPGSRITITHDQPWAGRIVLRFTDEPGGSRLSVTAELDDAGLAWWMEQRGWVDPDDHDPRQHRIGMLTSKTGPGADFALSCEYLARLAVDEVNDDGGIHGAPLVLEVRDDGTDPARAAVEAAGMIRRGCRAIVASVTSASFESIHRGTRSSPVPLIHAVLNEGGAEAAHVFRWGERPFDQVREAVPHLRRQGSDRRWFHIGNDYSWSRGAHRATAHALDLADSRLIGYQLVPLGTSDFSRSIDLIRATGARSIVSSLVGADEVAFQRQFFAAGARDDHTMLSLAMEESTRERVGDRVSRDVWSAFGYYSSLENDANSDLRGRYLERHGRWAPPISTFSEGVYEAIILYARAAVAARGDGDEVLRRLARLRGDLPRGQVELFGHQDMRQKIHVARFTEQGYRMAEG